MSVDVCMHSALHARGCVAARKGRSRVLGDREGAIMIVANSFPTRNAFQIQRYRNYDNDVVAAAKRSASNATIFHERAARKFSFPRPFAARRAEAPKGCF